MYCHKCGSKIKDDSAFCSQCGTKIENQDTQKAMNMPSNTYTHTKVIVSDQKFSAKVIAICIALVLILIGMLGNKDSDESYDTDDTDILYDGKPISTLMGKNSEEIEYLLGQPKGGTPVTGELLFGGTVFYTYDGISFWFDDQNDVIYISANADSVKIGKTSLDITRDELIEIIGAPKYEGDLPVNELGEGGYYVMEYLTEDDHLLSVNMFDIESPAFLISISNLDNAPESAYEEDLSADVSLDYELVGRWRSEDGGILQFDSSGIISNCNLKCWSIVDYSRKNNGAPDRIRWEASNGQVICYSEFDYDEPYQFSTSHIEYGSDEFTDNYEIMSIGPKNPMIAWHRRADETPEGSGLVGVWVDDNMPIWNIKFYSDGTGVWNSKFDCTWSTYTTDTNENRLAYTLYDTGSFDYYIAGDTLTVYLSNGSKTYTRVGN